LPGRQEGVESLDENQMSMKKLRNMLDDVLGFDPNHKQAKAIK
jgi:hypothetical protein